VTAHESSPVPRNRQDVFACGAYWREYYASLGHENREVGEFLLEAATSLSTAGLKILDAGCGPTLLYWAAFVPGDNEVYGFDINPSNIRDNKRRMDDVKRSLFDAGLVEAARHAIRVMSASTTPEDHLAEKGRQVVTLSVADLSRRWPYESEKFDLVQSCFALEGLPDWTSFEAALGEARRVLRSGGCLALVNSSQGTGWICDNHRFPTLFVTSDDMRKRIERSGLRVRSMREVESADTNWRMQGYSKVLLTSAIK
jgi:ubiquinone/menaquinone biosynthesis C-methylase UbiE